MYFSCMATKTITLEIDAYDKLKSAKKAGESFSEVVRKAIFPESAPTGTGLLAYYRSGGSGLSEQALDFLDQAAKHDPIPDAPWT